MAATAVADEMTGRGQTRGHGTVGGLRAVRGLRVALAAGAVLALGAAPPSGPAQEPTRPNIVVVLTDDQSPAMLERMAYVNAEPEGSWIRFANAFVSYPLCCPSRATILSGLYPHHHGVTGNSGGNFRDASTIATWLNGVGYTTGLFGKYLNKYPFSGRPPNYIPPGWDQWAAFRDQAYYDYELNVNGTWIRYGSTPAEYSTDVLAQKATQFASSAAEPFFLYLSPHAPHTSYKAAERHKGAYASLPIARVPNFNEADVSDKPAWIRGLSPIDEAAMIRRERGASETLLAVDDGIRSLVQALKDRGVLENTVIVFMTDNGYLFGNHRWNHKRAAYEESIRTPLLIRFPGAAERDVPELVVNTDIAPTLAELGGAPVPYFVDGRSLLPFLTAGTPEAWRTSVLLHYQAGDNPPEPWWGVRTDRWKYVELSTGELELYDLAADPYELENLAGRPEYAETRAVLADELRRLRDAGGVPPPQPPPNGAPTVQADTYSTAQDAALIVPAPGVLANDSDPDGAVLSALLVSGAAAGTVELSSDGSFMYTPASGFRGTDTFTYKATDGSAESGPATVTVRVDAPGSGQQLAVRPQDDAYVRSNAPSENTGSATTIRVYRSGSTETHSYLRFVVPSLDASVSRATLRLFPTRSSPVGGTLYPVMGGWNEGTITWVTRPLELGPPAATVGPVTSGTSVDVDVTGAVQGPGTYSFVLKDGSAAAWYGSEESATSPELLLVTGGEPPPNRAPTAADDLYAARAGDTLVVATPGVLANDGDADADPLTAALVTGPANGSLDLHADGSFTYTPNSGFTGPDTFKYRADDGTDQSNEATVTVTVSAAGGGSTTTLNPVDDAYVRSNAPTENTGSATTIRVYKSGTTETHSYLKFVVSGADASPTVTLRLYVTRASSVGGRIYAVNGSSWSEGSVTWSTRPAAVGAPVATIGPVAAGTWVEVELSGIVTGPGTYSLVLKDGGTAAWYSSGEGSNPPQLVVTGA